MKFAPDLQAIQSVDFRPYMVETAYDYCLTVLLSRHERGYIQQALAALAIEIVLKSYLSQAVANHGALNERYAIDKSALPVKRFELHDLRVLRDHLPPNIRAYLFNRFDEEVIEENHDAFTTSRYAYEPTSPSVTSEDAIRLAVKLVCHTVYLYKHFGCEDPFIRNFDVNSAYFKYVQPFAEAHIEF